MTDAPFRSPITGLPYITLTDLFPPLPESHRERDKIYAAARDELAEREDRVLTIYDIAFIALINRQISVLEKAKSLFKQGKYHVQFHGQPEIGAHYICEFEILSDVPNKDGD